MPFGPWRFAVETCQSPVRYPSRRKVARAVSTVRPALVNADLLSVHTAAAYALPLNSNGNSDVSAPSGASTTQITSSRGAHGGYSLARPPKKITVMDILCAIESCFDKFFCKHDRYQCKRYAECRTRPFWEKLRITLKQELTRTTVADLMGPQGHDHK